MFTYTVYKNNSAEKFKEACAMLEIHYNKADKDKLLTDVDGTQIQVYHTNGNEIIVFNDIEIGAVYIKSQVDLSDIF